MKWYDNWEDLQRSFNPSKVRYKHKERYRWKPSSSCFNPSKVRYKQKLHYLKLLSGGSFNPSKVRYKRILQRCGSRVPAEFQSLKGKIQTETIDGERDFRISFNPSKVRYKLWSARRRSRMPTCFNPSKVRYKRYPGCFNLTGDKYWFQSLKGKIQTVIATIGQWRKKSFNPSKVRYKRVLLEGARNSGRQSFNPSKVRYKRDYFAMVFDAPTIVSIPQR